MAKKRKIHFTGIGNHVVQELAIALFLAGHEVTASEGEAIDDLARKRLLQFGLIPSPDWSPDNMHHDLGTLVVGPEVGKDNPELLRAMELKVAVCSYPEFIYEVCKHKHRIVITGSHGKTLITLLILHVLTYHNRKFDYVVAKQVPGLTHSVRISDAPMAIIEGQDGLASVLDPATIFLKYKHHIGVISGIEWPPSAAYPTKEEYTRQFNLFEASTPKGGVLIYFDLEPVVTALSKVHQQDVLYIPYKTHPTTVEGGKEYLAESSSEKHSLELTGKHNLQNISAAKETVRKLGITSAMFYEAVQTFRDPMI